MSGDIVERLRAEAKSGNMPLGRSFDALVVADEIERLRWIINFVEEQFDPRYIDAAEGAYEEARREQ